MRAQCPFSPLRLALRRLRAAGKGLTLAATMLLAACTNLEDRVAHAVPPPDDLFADAQFGPASEPIDPAHVFDLSPAMRDFIDERIRPHVRSLGGTRDALVYELYSRSGLRIDYDASFTRNAAEAFEARKGNCLALVIMTGAFAHALDLNITYQQVSADEVWSHSNDMYFMSGHVNLLLDRRLPEVLESHDRYVSFTVDFLPGSEVAGYRVHPISEQTVLAMYLNNRSAEALVRGQLDDAYWRARQSIAIDPSYLSAFNTLGVVYARHGDPVLALRVFNYVLRRQPDNPRVLANEEDALRRLGRGDEADTVHQRLARLEPSPPFYFYNRGRAAMQAGDAQAARDWFRKELARSPDYHEFHFWLALADYALGRLDEARKEMGIALEDAVTANDREIYAAKLEKLNSLRGQTQVH